MLCAPPPNRKIHKRNIEKSEYAEYGRDDSSPFGIFDQSPQDYISDIENPQNKCGGESRVSPIPPNAPRGFGPDGTCDQRNSIKHQTHFNTRGCQPIPFEFSAPEIPNIPDESRAKRQDHHFSARGVEIKNTLQESHGF